MKIDQLFQFIVPLTFLAIWALTSLLNREAQPLPPRAGRPKPPNGTGGSSSSFRSEILDRDASGRWTSGTPARRPTGRPDDEIMIIEETRRPPGSTTNSA